MKRTVKRLLGLILCLSILLQICPVSAAALDIGPSQGYLSGCTTNPLYPALTEADIDNVTPSSGDTLQSIAEEYVSIETAAEIIRDGMVARASEITLKIDSEEPITNDSFENVIFPMAYSEALSNGPTSGDYLHWSWKSLRWSGSCSGNKYDLTLHLTYYTTADQETAFLSAMDNALNNLALEGKTTYQKIRTIYQYITDRTDYDYAALTALNNGTASDQDYLAWTAYGALVNGKAVCQGYACLLYAMFYQAGLPVRIIYNDDHAWNITKLGELWYNTDVTWDGQDSTSYLNHFLKGSSNFANHTPAGTFLTTDFTTAYPLSTSDYSPTEAELCSNHSYDDGSVILAASCKTQGTKRFTCTVCGNISLGTIPALGHRESEDITVDATCTQVGYHAKGCCRCDYYYIVEYISALSHDYEATVTKPSCSSSGYTTYSCSRCDSSYQDNTTPALSHNYTAVVTAPGCEAPGYTTYTCSDCSDSYKGNYEEATGHKWDAGSVSTETSCHSSGTRTYTCLNCGTTKNETISSTSHHHVEAVVKPTCTQDGGTFAVCTYCHDTYEVSHQDALGHDYSTQVLSPTCTEAGYTTYSCTRCEYKFVADEIPATNHSYQCSKNIAATCTVDGVKTFTCRKCGDSYSETTPATGHSYSTSSTKATCTQDGGTTHTCSKCGDIYTTNKIPASGHDYKSTEKKSTCTQQGYTTHTCSKCSTSYTDSYVAAKGHQLDEGTITLAPTAAKQGRIVYRCTNCSYSKAESIPATGNPFTDVKEGSYYFEPVLWAVDNGITAGTTVSTFAPEDACTRAHVVTFLWRMAGKPTASNSKNPFTDVASGAYYYDAVLWAVEQGITLGTSGTTFSPDSTCTRAQIVTFLYRYAQKPSANVSGIAFTDVAKTEYYYDAVRWAVSLGITLGTSDTTFSPSNQCTRGQSVTFLYRYDNTIG